MFRPVPDATVSLTTSLARRAMLAFLGTALALTGGCATYLGAQVTAFHQLSPKHSLSGRSFIMEAAADQANSLEYRSYADLVRQALIRNGLVDAQAAGTAGSAALSVSIRYSIDNGRPVSIGYPAYGYGNFGPVWGWAPYMGPGGGLSYAWTATYPVGFGMAGTHYGSAMLYRRQLKVEINERGGSDARLYEGTVVTEGESASLAPVMLAMVQALFYNFPGISGSSRIVQVRLDGSQ